VGLLVLVGVGVPHPVFLEVRVSIFVSLCNVWSGLSMVKFAKKEHSQWTKTWTLVASQFKEEVRKYPPVSLAAFEE